MEGLLSTGPTPSSFYVNGLQIAVLNFILNVMELNGLTMAWQWLQMTFCKWLKVAFNYWTILEMDWNY